MAASCEKLDQLVKDYLLFRGFSSTLKTLDQELKGDKDKGLRVDRMMEQIWSLLANYDLQGLREYWKYLNQRLFARLEQRYASSIRKLESSLLKLYIVNAHQCGRQDKVLAFFEQMGAELQSNPDFKDWFAFPFVAVPADNPMFSLYFNKQWQDTLQLSLHNFLSVVLQAMPVPTLLNVEFDARRMKTLQEENTSLKQQLMGVTSQRDQVAENRQRTRRTLHTELHPPSSAPDMVYDFSGLSSDQEPPSQEKQKSSRRFPLSLTSPLTIRKKSSDVGQGKTKSIVPPAGHTQAQGFATSTSTGAAQPARPTEMTVFPPPLPHLKQAVTEWKKSTNQQTTPAPSTMSVSSLASSSSSATAAVAASKHAVGGTVISNRSVSSGKPQSSTLISKSSSTSLHEASSANVQLVQRSQSTPSGKVDSGKVIESRNSADAVSSVETATSSNVTSGMAGRSLSVVERSDSPGLDPESPFLCLEDEYCEHTAMASFCRFSLSGQYIASLDLEGIVKVWMWSPQPATTATIMSKSAFLSLAWASKSDRWLLLGNKTGTIRLFDVKESKTYREVSVNPEGQSNFLRVTDLATSPSSSYFVSATADRCPFVAGASGVCGKLLQWDLRTLKLERTLAVDSAVSTAVTCSTYNQSGHLLLTGGADGFVRIYDASQARPVMKWQAYKSPIHAISFNGDKSIMSLGADGQLSEWSLSRPGQLMHTISLSQPDLPSNANGSPRARLFSLDLDNQYLLTSHGNRGAIYKTNASSPPSKVMELKSHKAPVITVDWSPSATSRVCLTGSSDGKIKILTLLETESFTKRPS